MIRDGMSLALVMHIVAQAIIRPPRGALASVRSLLGLAAAALFGAAVLHMVLGGAVAMRAA